jgi:hypothetical protein
MESLLLTLAVLACPAGMGLMMWMMMGRRRPAADDKQEQVDALRAEVEALKANRAAHGEGR